MLQGLKDCLMMTLDLLPENCLIGVITFGDIVKIHKLCGTKNLLTSFCYKGNKILTSKKLEVNLKL